MSKKESIQVFEDKQVRTLWSDEQEKWFLTESKDSKLKKMKV
ncbi:MAG: hypothetical protein WBK97_00155 [Bacteroidales bacterium]|jgi:hypothetical protein